MGLGIFVKRVQEEEIKVRLGEWKALLDIKKQAD